LSESNTFIFEQILLPKAFNRYKIDIYHATGNAGIPLFSKIKSVLTVHDLIPLQIENYFSYSKFPMLSRYIYLLRLKSSLKKASRIVTVSKYTRKELKKIGFFGSKTFVIYSGLVAFPKTFRDKNVYGNYILNNGGIDVRKNLDGLIKAFSDIKEKYSDLKLVITGENKSCKKELIKLVEKMKLDKSIIFTGYINNNKMASLIKNAKCLCYPSLIEGFGFPVLEAFFFRTPVIASNTSSIPEVAGNAAVLVNPKIREEISGAIMRVLKDNKLRNSLRMAGWAQVKKFSWENTINEYLDLYKFS